MNTANSTQRTGRLTVRSLMIFHAEKQNGFVMVDKAALNNPELSMRAKGLLCYLLSKPPDWRPQVKDICAHCKERRWAVLNALSELRKHGYAKLIKDRFGGGKLGGSYWAIFEKPATENAVSRLSVNCTLTKNNKYNKNEAYEDLKNFPSPEQRARVTKERLIEEVKFLCETVLKIDSKNAFWNEWMKRGNEAPFRTLSAIGVVAEDLAISKSKVKNPAAKANWYFRHLDLESGRIKK